MRKLTWLVSMALALVLTMSSCSDDEDAGATLTLDHAALYFSKGETLTLSFKADNIDLNTLSTTEKPKGWDEVKIDTPAKTITISAPAEIKDEVESSGIVRISGTSFGGQIATASVFVGIVNKIDLRDKGANSYILSVNDTQYTLPIDATEGARPAKAKIIWQTDPSLLKYLQLEKDAAGNYDHMTLFVGTSGQETKTFTEGNAVIGTFDASDNLLKSWHIWVTRYNPEEKDATVNYNGYTMMKRNLGAVRNSSENKDSVLMSYGLYYQWGRKTPFVGPYYYNCANGHSATMYDGDQHRVAFEPEATDAEKGTLEYATRHITRFLTTDKKDNDWAAASVQQPLWSASKKSANDPCPKGWRVAPAAAFEGLDIKENINPANAEEEEKLAEEYRNKFGWTLTDGSADSWFIGAGRRSYLDGKVQNYYDESLPTRYGEMQPWVGYYWTADTEGSMSKAFCFWLKLDDVKASGVRNNRPMGRANGMQVRCVRE